MIIRGLNPSPSLNPQSSILNPQSSVFCFLGVALAKMHYFYGFKDLIHSCFHAGNEDERYSGKGVT